MAEELARRRWNGVELEQRRKADAEKIKIARRLRAEGHTIAKDRVIV